MIKRLLGKVDESTQSTSRRSFFVDVMSWGAGLWLGATALSGLSGCGDDVAAKYGGPPPSDGSQGERSPDAMVAKYGGPPDGWLPRDAGIDSPVAKYGGPFPRDAGREGPTTKYGGPFPRDAGRDGPVAKYGGPFPRDAGPEGITVKYGGPPPKQDV